MAEDNIFREVDEELRSDRMRALWRRIAPFVIGAAVAIAMVPVDSRARAMAVMIGGLSIANVLGVPAGAFLGEHLGWRSAFWAKASGLARRHSARRAIGVVVMSSLSLLL